MEKSILVLILMLLDFRACYYIDDTVGLGRTFDGIGGLSGGGATSKLLPNYPEDQRNQILDYLFKPNFGASLHILKVELSGDTQAGEGTESSHMHEEWDENYERGYEWWLMKEAKKRNPAIKLYGLPWGFPGWIGDKTGSPYTNPNKTANYILKWIKGAKDVHGLDIDYIGIWNERQYDIKYIETLRSTLDINGFNGIKMVAADGGWDISSFIKTIPALNKAVDIIGCHYPGTLSTNTSVETGKALWASEDYSTFNDNTGAGCWARILNQNYVNGLMTSTISWNLIAAYYDDLPYTKCSLMTANEPWSGYYNVSGPIWITAHTTQFTSPGDKYFKAESGVGHLDNGGSYVTFQSSDGKDMTIVIETMTHNHSVCIRPNLPAYNVTKQEVAFSIKGTFQNITKLQVYVSQIGFDGKPSIWFKKLSPIVVRNGMFSLSVDIDQVYTITTITDRGTKGSYPAPPPPKPFPLPYHDSYDIYPEFSEAFNFVAQAGVWEVRNLTGRHSLKGNLQVMQQAPVFWCNTGNKTLSVGGDYKWADIYLQLDVTVPSINGTDGAFIALRVQKGGCGMGAATGLFFWIMPDKDGKGTYMVTTDLVQKNVLLKEQAQFRFDQPYSLNLLAHGNQLLGSLGMTELFSITVPSSPANGFAAYGTNTFGQAMFDNLFIDRV